MRYVVILISLGIAALYYFEAPKAKRIVVTEEQLTFSLEDEARSKANRRAVLNDPEVIALKSFLNDNYRILVLLAHECASLEAVQMVEFTARGPRGGFGNEPDPGEPGLTREEIAELVSKAKADGPTLGRARCFKRFVHVHDRTEMLEAYFSRLTESISFHIIGLSHIDDAERAASEKEDE